MKFYKYIDTLPENPSEGSFNSGDIIAVRKEVAGGYRWETYKVAADGEKYASSITVEEWEKLDSLSTSDISKLSGLNTQSQLDAKFQDQKDYTDTQVRQTVAETIDLKGATVLPRGTNIPSYITTVGKATLYGGTGGTTYTNTGLPAPNNVFTVQGGYMAEAVYNKSADTWSLGSSVPLPIQQGVDVINPTGSALPKEKAVADYVNGYSVLNIFSAANLLVRRYYNNDTTFTDLGSGWGQQSVNDGLKVTITSSGSESQIHWIDTTLKSESFELKFKPSALTANSSIGFGFKKSNSEYVGYILSISGILRKVSNFTISDTQTTPASYVVGDEIIMTYNASGLKITKNGVNVYSVSIDKIQGNICAVTRGFPAFTFSVTDIVDVVRNKILELAPEGLKENVYELDKDNEELKKQTYGSPLPVNKGIGVLTPAVGETIDFSTTAVSGGSIIMDVKVGDQFLIVGRGYTTARLYAFIDTDNKVLELASSGQITTGLIVTAKQDGKLIYNSYTKFTVGATEYDSALSKMGDFFNSTRADIKSLNNRLNTYPAYDRPCNASFNVPDVFEANVVYPDMFFLADPTTRIDRVYNGYDDLVSAHPEYVTKTFLGNANMSLPIYQYTFKPVDLSNTNFPRKRMKFIILTGVHGYEPIPPINVLHVMENICNNWKDDKALEFFRFNAEFIILPNANPTSILLDQRKNSNGVDVNRNFPDGWTASGDPSSETYSGPNALSEIETQIINQVLVANKGASALIDYHNFTISTSSVEKHFIWSLPNNAQGGKVCDEHNYRMLGEWCRKYPYIAPDTLLGKSSSVIGGMSGYQGTINEIPISMVYETGNTLAINPDSVKYDSQVMTISYEAFVNLLLQIAGELTYIRK